MGSQSLRQSKVQGRERTRKAQAGPQRSSASPHYRDKIVTGVLLVVMGLGIYVLGLWAVTTFETLSLFMSLWFLTRRRLP
jgi:hypothetical protein